MSLVPIGPSRVPLTTWADIVTAVDEGLLDETTYCELKKELPPKAMNAETARDLAAMSVLGGVLIVGIKDKGRNKAGDVVGVDDPHAQMSRLVALAQSVVQPSLVCDVYVVSDPSKDARGCIVCVIPPSASAPHRVEERYWGRSAEGKRVLSDPEVADLFTKRRHRDDGFREHLLGLSGDFDPIAKKADRSHGHLYFAARALQPNPSSVGPPPWGHETHLLELVNKSGMPNRGHGWGNLNSLVHGVAHPFGIMANSFDQEADLRDEKYLARLLVRDDGGVDFASGLGTVSYVHAMTDTIAVSVPVGAVLSYIDECVRLTALVARDLGLNGAWRLGVRMDKLLGAVSLSSLSEMRVSRAPRYAEREFLSVIDATASELNNQPVLVERLMAPLARGLGESHLFPYDEPHELLRG